MSRGIIHNKEGLNRVQFLCTCGKVKAEKPVQSMYILLSYQRHVIQNKLHFSTYYTIHTGNRSKLLQKFECS